MAALCALGEIGHFGSMRCILANHDASFEASASHAPSNLNKLVVLSNVDIADPSVSLPMGCVMGSGLEMPKRGNGSLRAETPSQ